ncbi:phosphopantetheine-binding protein [Alteriqipengyuania sp.]|uniref:phosphopantetheine-binding protein n=1 Tax=Alteriqipengyuania sp. TaxID=2800692 RepID=UPI0035122B5D
MSTMTLEDLRRQLAEVMEIDPADLPDDGNLIDLGLDSMRAMNLAMQWEEDGLELDFADLAESETLAGLWSLIAAGQEASDA